MFSELIIKLRMIFTFKVMLFFMLIRALVVYNFRVMIDGDHLSRLIIK